MDNGGISCNDSKELIDIYNLLDSIFNPYGFSLQQFCTNCKDLDEVLIKDNKCDDTGNETKLLGTIWDKDSDFLMSRPFNFNANAKTKRQILQTIASQYDLQNFNCPMMNRSRLFMHDLQCKQDLQWDDELPCESLREWRNISKQANSSPQIRIERCCGKRSDSYKLIACTDTSKQIYGVVLYLYNYNSGKTSFLLAKNRIINAKMQSKSIPALELQAILFGSQTLIDTYEELAGSFAVMKINIVDLELYCDSMVCLSWLDSHINKLDKMQKKSVFVINRLDQIKDLGNKKKISYYFIGGSENPADYVTRCVSYQILTKTNYISGPRILSLDSTYDVMKIVVPNPKIELPPDTIFTVGTEQKTEQYEHLIPVDKYSSFKKLSNVYSKVLHFINKLKFKVNCRRPDLCTTFKPENSNFIVLAINDIIRKEQRQVFKDIFDYFSTEKKVVKHVPQLVKQLNVFIDDDGLLRIRSKMDRLKNLIANAFPILLPRDSPLTELLILDLHISLSHPGCYSLLQQFRKRFWITKGFSKVKKVIKKCLTCRRFNNRTYKLNQSPYRIERLDPPSVPFNYVYLDYMGPFEVYRDKKKSKVWILCITCLWSRAINLKICSDLSVKEYIRSFQLHCFEWGLPVYCVSDLGSNLVAGANVISSFLNDVETTKYMQENNIKLLKFEQYSKGHSELGSLVESCVKMCKKLIYSSIRNTILSFKDFEFLICNTVHLINRRPVAFKDCIRQSSDDNLIDPITPEILLRGYELTSINVIPDLQYNPDPDWVNSNKVDIVRTNYEKLSKVRQNLIDIYHDEFVVNLINQATDRNDRYKPIMHKSVQIGDIVMIKDQFCKPHNYPLGIVQNVKVNDLGETTDVSVMKGKTREVTKRHVTNLIPLLSIDEYFPSDMNSDTIDDSQTSITKPKSRRLAAINANLKNKSLANLNLV